MIIVGIDIAKRNHEATVIDESGKTLGRLSFANSNSGAEKLLSFIEQNNSDNDMVVFGMEATGHYWLSLYSFLIERDFTVYVINPIQSDGLRNLYIRKSKNDLKDSFIIAEIIRFGRFTDTQLADENTLALKQLCRYRSYLVDQVAELKLKSIAILDQIFPEYEKLFSDIFGTSSKSLLLEYTTPEELLTISTEHLAQFLAKCSRGRFNLEKAQQIQDAAKNTFGIKIACEAFSFQLKQIIEQIQFLENHIKELENQIDVYFKPLDSHLTSIPGIGVVIAATIESEIGDINRFSSPEKLVAFAGLDPTVKQSGEFNGTRNRMSKRGSPYLRRAIWQAAICSLQYNQVLKEFYNKKRLEGKAHGTAVGAVARKLTYVIFAIMRDKTDYIAMD